MSKMYICYVVDFDVCYVLSLMVIIEEFGIWVVLCLEMVMNWGMNGVFKSILKF